jgi:hypothetical protein
MVTSGHVKKINAAKPKAGRVAMPKVTAWLDDLREAFGRDTIDELIRKATTEGAPTFYASENGYQVGVRLPVDGGTEISAAQMVIQRTKP